MTDVETALRKLQPLLPDEVIRWNRVREAADAETVRLLDQHILATARRELGNLDQQILLSLPPRELVAGPIDLGTVIYAGNHGRAGLSRDDLLHNVLIVGRSGAGKTNAVFHILLQLADLDIPFLFLDWKRTARHLLPQLKRRPNLYTPGRSISPLRFNPFTPPPALEPSTYIGHLVDVLADAYDLGDGAISLLQRALSACYTRPGGGNLAPSASDVLEQVQRLPRTGRASGWSASATRALQSIDFAGLSGRLRGQASQAELVCRFLHESTIVELDGLGAPAKRFLVPMLAYWVYQQRLAAETREKLRLVIVVEEAHHVLLRERQRGAESVMSMLLRQCREIGIGIIVVDQHPHRISSAALGNTAVTLVLNLKDPADVSKAGGLCGVDGPERGCFTLLPVGQAVVKLQDRWRRPFLVQIPRIHVEKGRVTDEVLKGWLGSAGSIEPREASTNRTLVAGHGDDPAGLEARSAGSAGHLAGSGQAGQFLSTVEALAPEALALLEDVLAHPDDGVRQRYARLRFSGERGHRAQRALLQGGWLEAQAVAVGNTRKTMLRWTGRATEMLGPKAMPAGAGSIAHAYWQRFYAAWMRGAGWQTEIEGPRGDGGRIDVVARRNDQSVAIEVETGKSDAVANVRACLRAGLRHVLVVATDRAALATVERRLAAAGLLVPQRVAVVRAPGLPPAAWLDEAG